LPAESDYRPSTAIQSRYSQTEEDEMDNQSSSRKSENPASGQSSVEKEKNVFEEFGDHVEKFASRTVESSESAAFLIEEGIKQQEAIFQKISLKMEKIEKLKEELSEIISKEISIQEKGKNKKE
jgi:hypothetical protein